MTVKHERVNLKADPAVARALLDDGWRVARLAAQLAPKDSGGGAASIRAELAVRGADPEVRVSWDQTHFYMSFSEFGTEHQHPHPFLRPAAAAFK